MRKRRYYMIGIGGIAMGSLAGLLKQKGYEVAGSDQEMYEPMKSMLLRQKIKVFTPYHAFHMKRFKPDIVVVGNAIGRGNKELEYAISNGHTYRSMSDILLEEFIDGRKAIVIAGTHGKTTTTALIAWILECAGMDPTIFIGGVDSNFCSSYKLGKGKFIVLEGDEYDTAFFDKGPKFWHYRPFVGLVNNIEYDHIDIYKNFDSYKYAFERLINLIPENGLLVANAEDKNVINMVKRAKAKFHMKLFGIKKGDYTLANMKGIETDLAGTHNISNILAAIAITRFLGVSYETIKSAIKSFKGVKRRAEVIGKKSGITIIDDYAHHPTAVRETLIGLKKKFHLKRGSKLNGRLFLMFEPGSASSKRKVFEKQYIEAFKKADIAYIYKPYKAGLLKTSETFGHKKIASILRKGGMNAKAFGDISDLLFHMKRDVCSGDIIVIMSCRGFDGLRERILSEL